MNDIRRTQVLFVAYCLSFIALKCAGQGGPGGGAKDEIPPEIISVMPAQDSTFVPINTTIRIVFSEDIVKQSVEDAIFIAPYPGEDAVSYKWKSRKDVTVRFYESLREDETYVITLGTDVQDLREKNKMSSSYQFAFSTGEDIDQGEISGRVYGEDAKSIYIWAYRLDSLRIDTLNVTQFPDYIIQTDEDGYFHLKYLKLSAYRLFAVSDKNNDKYYDTESDLLGIASKDVTLDSVEKKFDNLHFRLTLQDTTKPRLVSVLTRDNQNIVVTFSEPVDHKALSNDSALIITDTLNVPKLKILGWYSDPSKESNLYLFTDSMELKEYRLSVQNINDRAGNPIDTAFQSILFIGNETPDTVRPKLAELKPAHRTLDVLPDKPIIFHFDDAIDKTSFEENVIVQDTLENRIEGKFRWLNFSEVWFNPVEKFQSKTIYQIEMNDSLILDQAGNAIADTIVTFGFTTINTDTFGLISGTIKDENKTEKGGLVIIANSVGKDKLSYEIRLKKPSDFLFDRVLPGNYLLEAFRDKDNNGVYSYGESFPFSPSERFTINPDTVQVRIGGWETSGIQLKLRNH